jgi:predicted ABC-type transport system involved in lysophospholipase L1 biosynthesis ATPase subunit
MERPEVEEKGIDMSSNGEQKDRPLIALQQVTKVFLTEEVETHALADIHLEIPEGDFLSVAGPSGCGKSTLLSILGLLDTPTGGEYLLDGNPVAELSASQRARIRNRHIGFVFQAFNLIGDLTVYENVELPLTYRGAQRRRSAGAGRGGYGPPSQPLPFAAVGWTAAARRCGPRHRGRPADSPG